MRFFSMLLMGLIAVWLGSSESFADCKVPLSDECAKEQPPPSVRFYSVDQPCTLPNKAELRALLRQLINEPPFEEPDAYFGRVDWDSAQLLDLDGDGVCEVLISGGSHNEIPAWLGPRPIKQHDYTCLSPGFVSWLLKSDNDSWLVIPTPFFSPAAYVRVVEDRLTHRRYSVDNGLYSIGHCFGELPPFLTRWTPEALEPIKQCNQLLAIPRRKCLTTSPSLTMRLNSDDENLDEQDRSAAIAFEPVREFKLMPPVIEKHQRANDAQINDLLEDLYSGLGPAYLDAVKRYDVAEVQRIHRQSILPVTIDAGLGTLAEQPIKAGAPAMLIELLSARYRLPLTPHDRFGASNFPARQAFAALMNAWKNNSLAVSEVSVLQQSRQDQRLMMIVDQWVDNEGVDEACSALDRLRLKALARSCTQQIEEPSAR